jgi:hypothetical protein
MKKRFLSGTNPYPEDTVYPNPRRHLKTWKTVQKLMRFRVIQL